jgi:CRISPR system Cascade subunit CasE
VRGQKRDQDRGGIVVEPVRYDGHLIITDPDAFTTAILNGIGRAKAYGCGLLSLAPMRTTG